ncbi:MAG: hypothetical protein U0Q21_00005, partial [Dermatophilaceae bacterium]
QGTLIDGLPVLYKVPNFYLARTAAARSVGYDPMLKRIDHNDFFTTAYGRIVCVQDADWVCLHAQTHFDAHYQSFRTDLAADFAHLARKWGAVSDASIGTRRVSGIRLRPAHLRDFHAAAIAVVAADAGLDLAVEPSSAAASAPRIRTPRVADLREALVRAGWTAIGSAGVRHTVWGDAVLVAGAAPPTPRPGSRSWPAGWIARSERSAWTTDGDIVRAAVLPGGPVLDLGGPAALAAEMIGEDGSDLDQVLDAVVAAFPDAPAEAREQLRGTVLGLVEAGLLTWTAR